MSALECCSFAFTRPPHVSVHFNLFLLHCAFEAAHFSVAWATASRVSWLSIVTFLAYFLMIHPLREIYLQRLWLLGNYQ